MAHTDNTDPWRLRKRRRLTRKLRTSDSEITYLQRLYNRRDRHDARAELRRDREPEPVQPRGRAIWDAF